jgi:hypothetical protein
MIVVSMVMLRLAESTQAMDVLQIILHVAIITVTRHDVMSSQVMDAPTQTAYVVVVILPHARAVMVLVVVVDRVAHKRINQLVRVVHILPHARDR